VSRLRRGETEPETRVGNCCGCGEHPVTLFKITGVYRYRCDTCYERETGHRHHLAPDKTVYIDTNTQFNEIVDRSRRRSK